MSGSGVSQIMAWRQFWLTLKGAMWHSPESIFTSVREPSFALTLKVRGPSYLGLTMSISWLLMPWLLTSPGYQQPWYWLCRIGRFLSYLRKDFKYLRGINVEKWHNVNICLRSLSKNSTLRVKSSVIGDNTFEITAISTKGQWVSSVCTAYVEDPGIAITSCTARCPNT